MSEHLRSLIFIIALALITFFIAKKVTASIVSEQQFNRWRNSWLAITLIAFLAGNFWVFAMLSAVLLFYVGKKEQNPFALFLVLLFVIPRISSEIPGLGIVNFLFAIDYVTILSLMVLLPAYLSLRKNRETVPFLGYFLDKIILAYILLNMLLLTRDTTVTDALRAGVTSFADMFLPYYVASRSLKNLQQFKEVIAAFVIATMVTATAAMFEFVRSWLLYANLKNSLGVAWDMGGYLGRGDSLRALVTLGQPILLGYLMVMAMGCYLFISKKIKSKLLRWLGWGIILGGLYAPISRGPWVGAIALIVIFIAISPNAFKNMVKLSLAAAILITAISSVPSGQKFIDLLPFIGHSDTENVDYRVRLIDSAMIVFNRYPLLGSTKFYDELAALGMTQGEGIVDVVNSYLFEVLNHGLSGLLLFVGFFIIITQKLVSSVKEIPDKSSDMHLLGRALLASILATMVTITTVSSILVLPVIYWAFGGICIAYARMIEQLNTVKQAVELQTYRLAFDVMPALPASRVAFSALNKHQVVVDTMPIPRIVLASKKLAEQTNFAPKLSTLPKALSTMKTVKPELGSLYYQARKNRPIEHASYFEKTQQLPIKTIHPPKALPAEFDAPVKVGKLVILNGSNSGKVLMLSKVLSKLGKSNVQVAVIAKRENGHFIMHLEGDLYPIVNNVSIGARAHLLNNQDVIEVLGVKMEFLSDCEVN
ncbi:MAG: O-antigen ligase family protein [Methylophilaceae bacterium]